MSDTAYYYNVIPCHCTHTCKHASCRILGECEGKWGLGSARYGGGREGKYHVEEEVEKCQVDEEEKSGAFKIAEACQTFTLYHSISCPLSLDDGHIAIAHPQSRLI